MDEVNDDGFYSVDQLLLKENDQYPDAMEVEEEEEEANIAHTKDRRQLTLQERRFIVDNLLTMLREEHLPRGCQSKIANQLGVHRSTVNRVYKYIMKQREKGELVDVRTKKFGKTGPKPKEYSDEWLQSVPLYLRTTERSYAGALKVSHVTVHRLKKRGKIRTHTSNIHPSLTPNHKLARMQWVLSHITPCTPNTSPESVDMNNVIHIDEKWFYLNPETRRFYLLPKEEDPYRCQQSKRFKIKAMFMGMIARTLYDRNGKMIHDGKYGIFPFIFHQRAKKNSKNRVAGTLETKAVQNVNKEAIRDMLIQRVIPAIIEKWPSELGKDVYIQWDNARPHKVPTDEEFVAATTQHGFNIKLVYQPPQSQDLNVLDLGLFRAIQAIQYQSFPKNLSQLIEKVEEAYNTFDPTVNKYTWLTLQSCMLEILKNESGNNYRIPHMGKKRLESMGMLPDNVEVSNEIVEQAVKYLNERFRPSTRVTQDQEAEIEVDAD